LIRVAPPHKATQQKGADADRWGAPQFLNVGARKPQASLFTTGQIAVLCFQLNKGNPMDHVSVSLLMLFALSQKLTVDLAHGLLAQLTLGAGIHLILCPTILSGATALLVKYLVATRILPAYQLLSGSLLVLFLSWYIDKICKNNAYLLVRSAGLAIIFCAALGFVIVSEEGYSDSRARLETEVALTSDVSLVPNDQVVARD
jgi:hypothetical protein